MAIIHSSILEFFLHLLVLTIILVLILTNTFIAVKEFERLSVDTVILLSSYSLIILFVYAMYIGTTYSLINKRKDDDDISEAHKAVFNFTVYSIMGYDPVPPNYSNEEAA